jgi:hypothetical protein
VLRGQHTDSSDLDILIDRALESTLSKLSKYATSSAWRSVCRSRFWPQREFVERQLDGTQFQFLRTCNGSISDIYRHATRRSALLYFNRDFYRQVRVGASNAGRSIPARLRDQGEALARTHSSA